MLKQWKNFFEKFVNERNYFRKKRWHKIEPCGAPKSQKTPKNYFKRAVTRLFWQCTQYMWWYFCSFVILLPFTSTFIFIWSTFASNSSAVTTSVGTLFLHTSASAIFSITNDLNNKLQIFFNLLYLSIFLLKWLF